MVVRQSINEKGKKMIDSLKIAVSAHKVSFSDYRNFGVPEDTLKQILTNPNYITSYTNLSWSKERCEKERYKQMMAEGADPDIAEVQSKLGYMPQITIHCFEYSEPMIAFSFSAPSLIFSQNISEVQETDFYYTMDCLLQKLSTIGIKVSYETIEQADVWKVDLCKNFDLSGTIGADVIITNLEKLIFSKRLDNDDTLYVHEDLLKTNKVEGKQFSLMCKGYEICFYNKIAEISKNTWGKNFVLYLANIGITDVLRYEYRIQKAPVLKQKLEKCGFNKNLKFKDIFNQELVNALNKDVWNSFIEPKLWVIPKLEGSDDCLLYRIKKAGITGKSALDVLHTYRLYHSDEGFKSIDRFFDSKSKVLKRLESKVKQIEDVEPCPLKMVFDDIKTHLFDGNPMMIH